MDKIAWYNFEATKPDGWMVQVLRVPRSIEWALANRVPMHEVLPSGARIAVVFDFAGWC